MTPVQNRANPADKGRRPHAEPVQTDPVAYKKYACPRRTDRQGFVTDIKIHVRAVRSEKGRQG